MSQRAYIESLRLSNGNLVKVDDNVDSRRSDCSYHLMLNSLLTWFPILNYLFTYILFFIFSFEKDYMEHRNII